MRNEGNRWDPATVIGLHSHQEILVVGNPAFMPWLTEVCGDISSARKSNELIQLVRENEKFDRVIFSREATISKEMIPLAAALLKDEGDERGLIVFIPSNDGWTEKNVVDFYFPEANVSEYDSTFGPIITVDAPPTSWRMIHV